MECLPAITSSSSDVDIIPGEGSEGVSEHKDDYLLLGSLNHSGDIRVPHKRKRSAGGVIDHGGDDVFVNNEAGDQHDREVSHSQDSLSHHGKARPLLFSS